MAISDYKITTSDLSGKTVKGQSAILSGSVADNQQVFDNYPDVIKTKYNQLIDYFTATPPATSETMFPVGSIMATSTHSAPSYLAGTWTELTGLTLALTLGSSTSTLYFYQRII